MAAETDFDIELRSGPVRAHRYGPEGEGLVVGVPGLSANHVSMERLAEAVPMVAFDPRARGRSQATPKGTYGWPAHARDVLEIATRLGHDRFSVVGWSMGAGIGLHVARMAPERLERLVLVDLVAPVPKAAADLIALSVSRLGQVYPSLEEYLALARQLRLIEPWEDTWDRYFAYEMQPCEGGVRGLTDKDAVDEDFAYGAAAQPQELWPALTMPTLLLRARRPILPGTDAYIVDQEGLDRFREAVPAARVVEVDANHFGIGTHADSLAAVREFFAH